MGPASAASPGEAERQRRVRRSAVLFAVIAAGFYLAFIAVMLVRAVR